jgi:hypothetical protein
LIGQFSVNKFSRKNGSIFSIQPWAVCIHDTLEEALICGRKYDAEEARARRELRLQKKMPETMVHYWVVDLEKYYYYDLAGNVIAKHFGNR